MKFKTSRDVIQSFTYLQCVDTLQDILSRLIKAHADTKEVTINDLKNNYLQMLNFLSSHPSDETKKLCHELSTHSIKDHASTSTLIEFLNDKYQSHITNIKRHDSRDSLSKKESKSKGLQLVLVNLRSAHNVGNILRTCEVFNISEVHLCGITPTPENEKVTKTSLSTHEWIKWKYWENALECLKSLKSKDNTIYSFETSHDSQKITDINVEPESILVFGNEKFGLSEEVLNLSDKTIEIPMLGKKNSLNVCNAVAIATYHFTNHLN
ncbi:RNA methyltransferase [Bacteriovoracaceae bacterium]|nr:RNA methyltransferase [Bacteriovoracaceae bacterium]